MERLAITEHARWMPPVATVIMLAYAVHVAVSRSPHWHEWAGAAFGVTFSAWYWWANWRLDRKIKEKNKGEPRP